MKNDTSEFVKSNKSHFDQHSSLRCGRCFDRMCYGVFLLDVRTTTTTTTATTTCCTEKKSDKNERSRQDAHEKKSAKNAVCLQRTLFGLQEKEQTANKEGQGAKWGVGSPRLGV